MSATTEFLHPERLWWLLAIPFLVLSVSAIGARSRAIVPRLVSVLLRSILLALPVVILAGPQVETTTSSPARVDVLVDSSRSVPPAAVERALAHAASWSSGPGYAVRVMGFGDRPRVLASPGADAGHAASRASDARDLASDPNPAVAILRLLDPGLPVASLALFTDGAVEPPRGFVSGGHPTAVVVPMPPAGGPNVRLDAVRTASDGGGAAGISLDVRGGASARAAGVVRVLVDGVEARSLPVEVGPGPFDLAVPAGVLPPGRHVVGVWFDGGDVEPLDDELGIVVDVPEPAPVMLIAPEGRSLLSSALRAQGIEHDVVAPPDLIQSPALLDRAQVLVLDRMAVEALSAPEILERISSLVIRGGGVLFVPRENPGELVAGPSRRFLELLPFSGRPLEPRKEEPPKKKPLDEEGLKPPEPDKKKIERRPAPTLGLLLLIDCSSSMKGQTLRLAKEAAIAASEVLHPEDRIGVVAFNDEPLEVVPMTRAGERDSIVDQISRIKAEGGTDFGPALDQARAIFREEDLQIKHCVLLSDGHSRLGRILDRVEKLAREGVTLSTVGVGPNVDIAMLSDMAVRGQGKYNPAYSAEAIPQIVTIEAERVVTKSGARRPFEIEVKKDEPAEAPRPGPPDVKEEPPPEEGAPPEEAPRIATPVVAEWPAVYLKGVHPEVTQGIFDWHRADPAPHAWISIATKTGDPVVAHTYIGFGRLVAFTTPLQGPAPGPLVNWTDYANFASQIVRFLTPATRPARLQLRVEAAGRAARLDVLDVERKEGALDRIRLEFRDHRARPVAVAARRTAADAFDLEVPSDSRAALIDVLATIDGEGGSGSAAFDVARPPEIARLESDLAGLNAWADALHGEVVAAPPADLGIAPEVVVERAPLSPWWLVLLIPVFLLDLAVKRLFPGSFS